MFLATGCSSVTSYGGGGVLMGVATVGRGATARWGLGAIVGGGSTVGGGSSTSKNRSSHHNYRSPKQFELKQS